MDSWHELDKKWQRTMQAALKAYLSGSAPIGAVVFNIDGKVVSVGTNDIRQRRLAHAEIQALNSVPSDATRIELALYSTMEPCPMCTGAIRMMQLGALHFAAKDPAAGSTELLTATRFMQHFACEVVGPTNGLLEFVNVALTLEYRTRNGHRRWRDAWYSYLPDAVEVGEDLASNRRFAEWKQNGCSFETIFHEVASNVR